MLQRFGNVAFDPANVIGVFRTPELSAAPHGKPASAPVVVLRLCPPIRVDEATADAILAQLPDGSVSSGLTK